MYKALLSKTTFDSLKNQKEYSTHLRCKGRENRGEIVLIFYKARANAVIMWWSDKHENWKKRCKHES